MQPLTTTVRVLGGVQILHLPYLLLSSFRQWGKPQPSSLVCAACCSMVQRLKWQKLCKASLCSLLKVKGMVAQCSAEPTRQRWLLWTTPVPLYIIGKFRAVTRAHQPAPISHSNEGCSICQQPLLQKKYCLRLTSLTRKSRYETAQLGKMEFWIWLCYWHNWTIPGNNTVSSKLCQQ